MIAPHNLTNGAKTEYDAIITTPGYRYTSKYIIIVTAFCTTSPASSLILYVVSVALVYSIDIATWRF